MVALAAFPITAKASIPQDTVIVKDIEPLSNPGPYAGNTVVFGRKSPSLHISMALPSGARPIQSVTIKTGTTVIFQYDAPMPTPSPTPVPHFPCLFKLSDDCHGGGGIDVPFQSDDVVTVDVHLKPEKPGPFPSQEQNDFELEFVPVDVFGNNGATLIVVGTEACTKTTMLYGDYAFQNGSSFTGPKTGYAWIYTKAVYVGSAAGDPVCSNTPSIVSGFIGPVATLPGHVTAAPTAWTAQVPTRGRWQVSLYSPQVGQTVTCPVQNFTQSKTTVTANTTTGTCTVQ